MSSRMGDQTIPKIKYTADGNGDDESGGSDNEAVEVSLTPRQSEALFVSLHIRLQCCLAN
jgi:hypothetical protein